MTFEQIQFGEVFYIDDAPYQVFRKYGRTVGALLLSADFQHVPDADDLSGFGLKTTIFSDLRFNMNNATLQEQRDYLNALIAKNKTT